jgi:hypothetical protein
MLWCFFGPTSTLSSQGFPRSSQQGSPMVRVRPHVWTRHGQAIDPHNIVKWVTNHLVCSLL